MKGSEVPCGIRPKSKQSVEIALTTVEIALNSLELDLNEVWNKWYFLCLISLCALYSMAS